MAVPAIQVSSMKKAPTLGMPGDPREFLPACLAPAGKGELPSMRLFPQFGPWGSPFVMTFSQLTSAYRHLLMLVCNVNARHLRQRGTYREALGVLAALPSVIPLAL